MSEANNTQIVKLHQLAEKQLKLEEKIKYHTDELAINTALLKKHQTETFPEIMEEYQIPDITVRGKKIEVIKNFYCGMPSMSAIASEKDKEKQKVLIDRRAAAFGFIDDSDYNGIIKRQVIAEFGKNQTKESRDFKKLVRENFATMDLIELTTMNANSLKSTLKTMMAKGINVPKDTFGIGNISKVIVERIGE